VSDTQDIRLWAQAQGLDVKPKGKIPVAVMEQWNSREEAPYANGSVVETPPDEGTGELQPPGGDTAETRPDMGKTKLWWGKDRKPKEPKPSPRRVSIENLVSGAWSFGAWFLSSKPQALPVARVLDMQAPVAGIIVNDVAKGTPVDKALQPIARMSEKGGKAAALLGPAVIVGAITANPQLYGPLRPILKMSIMSWMEISEPAMKKAQARAARFEEKFGGVDVDSMIDALFAPPEAGPWAQTADDTAEEEAIRRAKGES
jgi:hypothetical protein